MRFREMVVGICVCLWFSTVTAKAELRAGAARIDLTPEQAVPLGGYAARRGALSTGVHDRVYARALVLAEGATKVGIVSVDLCFLPANVVAEVARRVSAAGVTGLDAAHLLIAATHTHSAPDPLAMHKGNTFTLPGWTPFDAALLDFTAGRIAKSIEEADRQLQPAKLGSAVGEAAHWNKNRRGGTTVDPALTVLKVTDANGQPLAAIVNYASHPTIYSDAMRAISADWPGVMTAEVEKAQGGKAVCLFLNGAEGDAGPANTVGDTMDARVQNYGDELGKSANDLLAKVAMESTPPLSVWTQAVMLPTRKPNGLFLVAATSLGATIEQARQFVDNLMPTTTQLSFARVGKLLWMGFPCEPTAALGLAAKAAARQAGFATPAVVALTNDWLAYALTPEEYRAGKYEAGMSFYGDQLGPALLAALNTGLKAAPGTAASTR